MEQEKPKTQTPEERYHQETHCQSCGRFVGIYTRCPYCQALTQKRLSIRVFKWVAVLTSTVGLLMLLFFARHVKTPEVKIADLGPLSNFAHVRIVGEVTQSYGVHPKWGSLGFVMTQGDAENPLTIRVSAYAKVAKEIEAKNLVPNKGDVISIEGQVRFQKDTPSLLINAHEHIAFIKRGAAPAPETVKDVDPDKIDNGLIGRFVNVTGSVLSTKKFPTGTIINIDDGKSGFPIWVPADCLESDQPLRPGDLVEANGKVETFKDKLEVKVLKKGAFKVVSRVSADTVTNEAPVSETPAPAPSESPTVPAADAPVAPATSDSGNSAVEPASLAEPSAPSAPSATTETPAAVDNPPAGGN
ncbi:MAG TPA: hypothetical protein PLK28_15905 [Candidatus Rifleibacterium sp.]|nr:hypothetical protein [Candidatus Rifleibacterium sp.]